MDFMKKDSLNDRNNIFLKPKLCSDVPKVRKFNSLKLCSWFAIIPLKVMAVAATTSSDASEKCAAHPLL